MRSDSGRQCLLATGRKGEGSAEDKAALIPVTPIPKPTSQ
jgi:hypothetical protein